MKQLKLILFGIRETVTLNRPYSEVGFNLTLTPVPLLESSHLVAQKSASRLAVKQQLSLCSGPFLTRCERPRRKGDKGSCTGRRCYFTQTGCAGERETTEGQLQRESRLCGAHTPSLCPQTSWHQEESRKPVFVQVSEGVWSP
mgnify:CR=1 FL=1